MEPTFPERPGPAFHDHFWPEWGSFQATSLDRKALSLFVVVDLFEYRGTSRPDES